jgi:hypothetical protein
MTDINERVDDLEKDVIGIKGDINSNLTGEHSVWSALEKFAKSVDEFRKVSEGDRKEIREMVHTQALESVKMSTAYAGMAGILKAVGTAVIVAILGILVGLFTHTIQIGS